MTALALTAGGFVVGLAHFWWACLDKDVCPRCTNCGFDPEYRSLVCQRCRGTNRWMFDVVFR